MLRLALSGTACVLCGCATPLPKDSAVTTVPYEVLQDGRVAVEVHLNDQGPYSFVLDTAASISLVAGEFVDELELPLLDSVRVHGLTASDDIPVLNAGRLRLGDETWENARVGHVSAESNATARIDGLLGLDFLKRYGVEFEASEGLLRLYLPESLARERYRGWASIPLEPRTVGTSSQPLYFMQIEIGGREISGLFDVGSSQNIINTAAARYLRVVPVSLDGYQILSGPLAGAAVFVAFETAVSADDVEWRNTTFLIADLQIFQTLLHETTPLAIVGSELFAERDFVIDFAHSRLLVSTIDD